MLCNTIYETQHPQESYISRIPQSDVMTDNLSMSIHLKLIVNILDILNNSRHISTTIDKGQWIDKKETFCKSIYHYVTLNKSGFYVQLIKQQDYIHTMHSTVQELFYPCSTYNHIMILEHIYDKTE